VTATGPAGGVGQSNADAAVPPAARAAILAWYDARGRSLPFRGTADPYAILVSEVMAQQTQVDRVGPAWLGFLEAFPSFEVLAAATPAAVLRAWAGLGYNRRALNLWRAATTVVDLHGGELPADLESLMALPGVGPYTARAVAAIAFGRPVGAVDTNVRRVLSRIAGASATDLQHIADAIVRDDRPADWTHAVMDVGATFCRSVRPRCADCPASPWCRFARAGSGRPESAEHRPKRRRMESRRFDQTSRWLRGRILEQLRAEEGWLVFDEPIGDHDVVAVRAALVALSSEGLLELDAGADPAEPRARLPLG
jgi:A/G-specific adenine glycosylase